MQTASSVDNSPKKISRFSNWRSRHRSNFQVAAIGLGVVALLSLLFSAQDEQIISGVICFTLLVVILNFTAWAD